MVSFVTAPSDTSQRDFRSGTSTEIEGDWETIVGEVNTGGWRDDRWELVARTKTGC